MTKRRRSRKSHNRNRKVGPKPSPGSKPDGDGHSDTGEDTGTGIAPENETDSPARRSRLRIGVTGASGFIGRALVDVAATAGHRVIGFSRDPEQMIPGAVEVRDFAHPELADYSDLDVVVHLAGEPVVGLWTGAKKRRILESRTEGTAALVRGIEKMRSSERPGAFVCASGIGYYGDAGDDIVDEDNDAGFGFLAGVVRGWEASARVAGDIGLRACMARIGLVIGETGGLLPTMSKAFRAYLGGRLGSGRQWMSWIHVRDAACALLECAENPAISGPVNIVGPRPVTNREFTATLARLLQRPAVLPAPAFVLKRAPGGMGEMFLGSQRVDPAELRLRGFAWDFPDLEPALRDALRLPV